MAQNGKEKLEIRTPDQLISKLRLKTETGLVRKIETVIQGVGLSTEEQWKRLRENLGEQDSQKIIDLFQDEDPKLRAKLIDSQLDNLQLRSQTTTGQRNNPQQTTPETSLPIETLPTPPKPAPAELMEHPWEWAKENKVKAGLGVVGTLLVGYLGYKAISGIFGGSSSSSERGKDKEESGFIDSMLEKIGIKGDYLKWAKRFGLLGLVAAVGIGLFMGKDKIDEYWEKAKDFFGIESKEEKEAFEKMAKTISDSNKTVPVRPETIKKIKGEKVKDFISMKGKAGLLVNEYLGKGASFLGVSEIAKSLGIKTEEEIKEIQAIRDYLIKENDDKRLSIGKEDTTIGDLCKAMSGNPELAKDVVDKNIVIGAGAVALANASMTGTDKKREDKKAEKKYTGYIPAIIGARIYQGYHGVHKPYVSLSLGERNILKGSLRHYLSRDVNVDFKQAQASLSTLEGQLANYNTVNLDEKAQIIKQEFETGKGIHPKYGDINIKDTKLTPDKYYKYLSDQEHNLNISALEGEIKAIKGGPEAFKQFQILRASPEKFLERLHGIENRRYGMYQKMTGANIVEAQEWKGFVRMGEELNNVINEKNLIVGSIASENNKLTIEYQTPSTSSARKIQIEGIVKSNLEKIKGVETELRSLTERFISQNEKQLINIMDSTNEKTLRMKFKNFIPNLKGDTRATDLLDLDLVSPKKKFFRLSLSGSGNKLMLLGIGAGTLLSLWDGDQGKINTDHLIHTAKRVGYGFVPVYGTYLDSRDMIQAFSQGEMLAGFANMGAMTASGLGDALLAMSLIPGGLGAPLGLGAKGALTSLRTFVKSGAGIKSITESTEVLKGAKTVLTVENAAGKIATQEVLELERLTSQIAEGGSNVSRSAKDVTTMILRRGMVLGTATALGLGVGVPLVSYGLNKAGILEQEKVEQK